MILTITLLIGGLRLDGRRDGPYRLAQLLWAGILLGAGFCGHEPVLIAQVAGLATAEVVAVFILLR